MQLPPGFKQKILKVHSLFNPQSKGHPETDVNRSQIQKAQNGWGGGSRQELPKSVPCCLSLTLQGFFGSGQFLLLLHQLHPKLCG